MKILITGGAGFIGSHMCEALLAEGQTVLVIDNFSTGFKHNLPNHPALELVEADIAEAETVQRLFERFQPETVIHAAASYKNPDAWQEDIRSNILGSANIVIAAKSTQVSKLIYFQTALCYGLTPLEQPVSLSHPFRPEGSSYAISKTAAEQYIELSGINYNTFRLANIIGPRNFSGPLATFYHRLSQEKPCFVMDTRREFVFIDDLVAVVLKSIHGKGRRGAYHVATGGDFSIQELFETTLAVLDMTLDKPVEVRPRSPDDAFTILLDPTETRRDFDWAAETIRAHELDQRFIVLSPI